MMPTQVLRLKLFINMIDLEGSIVYDSAVGAFGLQLLLTVSGKPWL